MTQSKINATTEFLNHLKTEHQREWEDFYVAEQEVCSAENTSMICCSFCTRGSVIPSPPKKNFFRLMWSCFLYFKNVLSGVLF